MHHHGFRHGSPGLSHGAQRAIYVSCTNLRRRDWKLIAKCCNECCRYNLSQRIYDIKAYPVQSPQGASILIYGQENGVSLLWRGGRRLRPAKLDAAEPAPNGAMDDAVMIIDSDDEDVPSSSAFVDRPQFEDADEPSPIPETIQTLDLALGTAVLSVAVMPLAPCAAAEAAAAGHPMLSEKAVFAVSCVTNDVYLIIVPLTPPSPESKERPDLRANLMAGKAGSRTWGESVILLGGLTRHSEGLAMSLITPENLSKSEHKQARVVVAACSRQASGALLLWDVPLDSKGTPDRPIEPFQTEFLPSPLRSISFNPTHRTQLLTVSAHEAVRIYDLAISPLPPDPEATGPFPTQGSWLLSLYQPFVRPSSSRKPILDAAWISHGQAIFVLLADGMWGIWDVGGVNPVSSSGAAISNKLRSGVRGAALTAFSVSGYVEGTSSLRSAAAQQKEPQGGGLAPMTPHTRRQASAALGSSASLDRLSAMHGGVRAIELPSTMRAPSDESIALWIGGLEHVCIIPSISRFWDSQLRKEPGGGVNLFSGTQPSRMIKLADLSMGLLGERCCGVSFLADHNARKEMLAVETTDGPSLDVLIQGESRFVVVGQGDGGHIMKAGILADSRRRRLFSKGDRPDAVIVHGKQDKRIASISYSLRTSQPGSMKLGLHPGTRRESHGAQKGLERETQAPSRPNLGFDFMNTLEAAADASADLEARNVEAEMLDIMEIDQVIDGMEGR